MKCGTASCSSSATTRVFWPGQTIDLCDPCTERASGIAGHMGFAVDVRPLISVEISVEADSKGGGDPTS